MKVAELMDQAVKFGLALDEYINEQGRTDDSDMLMVKVIDKFNAAMPKVYAGFNTSLGVTLYDENIVFEIKGDKRNAQ